MESQSSSSSSSVSSSSSSSVSSSFASTIACDEKRGVVDRYIRVREEREACIARLIKAERAKIKFVVEINGERVKPIGSAKPELVRYVHRSLLHFNAPNENTGENDVYNIPFATAAGARIYDSEKEWRLHSAILGAPGFLACLVAKDASPKLGKGLIVHCPTDRTDDVVQGPVTAYTFEYKTPEDVSDIYTDGETSLLVIDSPRTIIKMGQEPESGETLAFPEQTSP